MSFPARFLPVALILATALALAWAIADGGRAVAGHSACNPGNPSACLYVSDLGYDDGVLEEVIVNGAAEPLELVDATRNDYRVPLLVRYPIDPTGAPIGPRPVVIWHHGGGAREDGKTASHEWGRLLAKAGYIVIHPSRVWPDSLDQAQHDECAANGYDDSEEECKHFLGDLRYGAINTAFIIANLSAIEASVDAASGSTPLAGLLDHDTIAVAGFSAGTTAVHVNAGAWQQWSPTTTRYQEPIPEPVAFFAAGPQGPMYAGFGTGFQSKGRNDDLNWESHSWTGIDRPYMFITGVGDETNEPPESRVAGFLTSQGNGNKFLLWNTQYLAVHGTMNIHQCDEGPRQADHCAWIGSAGLAYFDAIVRGRRHAAKWLASDALAILTGGEIELHQR